ncbi:phosphoglycerate mutase family protein [Algoriphagus halophytocola]|uniref:Histidine phosphatase family protein n=1 Tax=Algoriphagus halophytocola TaxID=2991499 RepID=A0ABY6MER3_9BACT|nr:MULTISPECIES: phosphoglycerate mutase family protein [unclassified Algoriphagus]UZD21121.1 histidine phosphatase family protein [Algoriphagus sp. TR-M5]WBL42290.1 phosphoglycerate mutase family protein [Algoriphagus sp. TR-M9]
MKTFLFFLFTAFMLSACSTSPKPKTIYIVRHAEKQLDGNDPELSTAGSARARKLAQILAGQNIQHIFSTDYQRTRMTAKPTADQAGISINSYDPQKHDELVIQLRSLEGNILVVGHSNTVGQVANYFVEDGEQYEDLGDTEYNFIYVVTLAKDGTSSVERKTYKDY